MTDITFERDPSAYRHWRVRIDGSTATVLMAVDPDGGLRDGYELKSNSYDLGVDIELYDIVQRLRFEQPTVRVVMLTGGLDKLFCAGANIQMLAGSTHHHKVNFCKFTNETRNSIEDASARSGQVWIAALNGTAAGGGYEVALACDEIILVDDRSSTVSLPEVPLLGVLPGTGGLTRLVDKRFVRRDRADAFATRAEGMRGELAVQWRLVDSLATPTRWAEHLAERAAARAVSSDRPLDRDGVELAPLGLQFGRDEIVGNVVSCRIDRGLAAANITVQGPLHQPPADAGAAARLGAQWWALQACRELDAIVLHLRVNELAVGTWILETAGDPALMAATDAFVSNNATDWFVREVRLYWARTLKRLDVSARTLVALIQPGSAMVGLLAELALVADRSLMLDGTSEPTSDGTDIPAPTLVLTEANNGAYPMSNGLSRLEARFWGCPDELGDALAATGTALDAEAAHGLGLISDRFDDIDWEDEVRLLLEERASFSPDALTGLEANLRFVGPETMETKIFARLSAWQNWIFQRPNAAGPEGALRRYGTGARPEYDPNRV